MSPSIKDMKYLNKNIKPFLEIFYNIYFHILTIYIHIHISYYVISVVLVIFIIKLLYKYIYIELGRLKTKRKTYRKYKNLQMSLEKKYKTPVALVNCMDLNSEDVWHIMEMVLDEFPAKEADIFFPAWTAVLPEDHILKKEMTKAVTEASHTMKRLHDMKKGFSESLVLGMTKAAEKCGAGARTGGCGDHEALCVGESRRADSKGRRHRDSRGKEAGCCREKAGG